MEPEDGCHAEAQAERKDLGIVALLVSHLLQHLKTAELARGPGYGPGWAVRSSRDHQDWNRETNVKYLTDTSCKKLTVVVHQKYEVARSLFGEPLVAPARPLLESQAAFRIPPCRLLQVVKW
jgi:hypothetical protein